MFKAVNGIDVAYQVSGPWGRPWVVLVHGFPFSGAVWAAQVEALESEFQVLSYDLRGLGQSQLGDAPPSIDTYVDDLIALLDRLGIARAGLVGHSLGGYIALRAIERADDRFWSLVLCDTTSDPDDAAGKQGRDAAILALDEHGVEPFVEKLLPRLLALPETTTGAALLALMRHSPVAGMKHALSAMRDRSDTTGSLARIAVPVLVIVGDGDVITPPSAARALVAHIGRENRGAILEVLADAGHVSNLEAAAAFDVALLTFLERAAPPPVLSDAVIVHVGV